MKHLLFIAFIASFELWAHEQFLSLNETTPLLARNWSLKIGKYSSEREYEDGDNVLDQRDLSAWSLELSKGYVLTPKFSAEIGVKAEFFGKSNHRFNHNFSRPTLDFRYKGLRALRARGIYQYQDTSQRRQGLVFEIQGLPWYGRDGRAGQGGIDLGAAHLSRWHFESGLFSQTLLKVVFFGAKKIKKNNSHLERTDPYSSVEFQGTLGHQYSAWFMSLTPGFGLSNDYNIRSFDYHRQSDKGFSLHLKATLAYMFSTGTLSLEHVRRSHVFNNISDLPSDEIDFEIESNATALEYVWAY